MTVRSPMHPAVGGGICFQAAGVAGIGSAFAFLLSLGRHKALRRVLTTLGWA